MTCMPMHSSPPVAALAFALIVGGTACADEAPALPRGGHALGADSAAFDAPARPKRGHALGADMAALDAAGADGTAAKGADASWKPVAAAAVGSK